MPRPVSQGDVAKILNPLVEEGMLVSFRTNFVRDRPEGWSPEVIVTVAGEELIANTLELVREMLEPLSVTVTAEVGPRSECRG